MNTRMAIATGLAAAVGLASLGRGSAQACSPPPPVQPFALPRPASVPISTATSIYVIAEDRPAWVEVTAGGTAVKTDGVEPLGDMGLHGSRGKLWRVLGLNLGEPNGILQPSVEYVVSATVGMNKVELTRFTTASGYDKQQGTAPLLRSIKLWRVRYPVSMVGGGMCVSAEYHAFAELDYDPAAIPDTPSESVLYTLSLWPKTGGASASISFTGADVFKGGTPQASQFIPWYPAWPTDLDSTREYCATLTARGYGDIARLPLRSEKACASVTSLEYTKSSDGGGVTPDADNGCSCRVALSPARAEVAVAFCSLLVALFFVLKRHDRALSER